jgi:hypothetical protein
MERAVAWLGAILVVSRIALNRPSRGKRHRLPHMAIDPVARVTGVVGGVTGVSALRLAEFAANHAFSWPVELAPALLSQ